MPSSPGLRLQHRDEPPCRVIGAWRPGQSPVTYNFLHSGKLVPWWLASFWQSLPPKRQEAFYLPRDIGLSPLLEALLNNDSGPMLYVDVARTFVDLNRTETDLKPEGIDGPWPFGTPDPWEHGALKDCGLLALRCDATEELLYDGAPIALADAVRRVEEVYRPGWLMQDEVLAQGVALFGEVVLMSMHSYNVRSNQYMGGPTGVLRKEICLSDLHGQSTDSWAMQAYVDSFIEQGFEVGVNDPVSGAWDLRRMVEPMPGGIAMPPSELYETGLKLPGWRPGATPEAPRLKQLPQAKRLLGVHALQIEYRRDLLTDDEAVQRMIRALLAAEARVAGRLKVAR